MSRTVEAYINIVERLIQREISKYEVGTFSDRDIEWITDNAVSHAFDSVRFDLVDIKSRIVFLVNEMY